MSDKNSSGSGTTSVTGRTTPVPSETVHEKFVPRGVTGSAGGGANSHLQSTPVPLPRTVPTQAQSGPTQEASTESPSLLPVTQPNVAVEPSHRIPLTESSAPVPGSAPLASAQNGPDAAPIPRLVALPPSPPPHEPSISIPAPPPSTPSNKPSNEELSLGQLFWAQERFSPELDAALRTKYEAALSSMRRLIADSSSDESDESAAAKNREMMGTQALDLMLKVTASEFEQGKRNDTKAVACLAAVAVMASLTTALLPGLMREEFRGIPWMFRCALAVGVLAVLLCLGRAATFALQSLRVTWFNVLGPEELVPPVAGDGTKYKVATAATLLEYTIQNYEPYARQAMRVDVALGCLLNAVVYMFLGVLLSLVCWAFFGTPAKPLASADQATTNNAFMATHTLAGSAEKVAVAVGQIATATREATAATNKGASALQKTVEAIEQARAIAEKLSTPIATPKPKSSRAKKHAAPTKPPS